MSYIPCELVLAELRAQVEAVTDDPYDDVWIELEHIEQQVKTQVDLMADLLAKIGGAA